MCALEPTGLIDGKAYVTIAHDFAQQYQAVHQSGLAVTVIPE